MAAGPSNLNSPDQPIADSKIKIKDVEFPVRRWAIACISLVGVLVATCVGGIYVWKNWKEAETRVLTLDAEKKKLEKAKSDSEEATMAKLREYKYHFKEKGQLLTPRNGWVEVTLYPSDGCILINRKDANPYNPPIDNWILSPLKAPRSAPPDGAGTPTKLGTIDPPQTLPERLPVPPVELKSTSLEKTIHKEFRQTKGRLLSVQAGCMNPHPGPFQTAWGVPNGCWVPLFRTWRDGCNHSQWFNSCSGYWDPRINWNYCAVQHFW